MSASQISKPKSIWAEPLISSRVAGALQRVVLQAKKTQNDLQALCDGGRAFDRYSRFIDEKKIVYYGGLERELNALKDYRQVLEKAMEDNYAGSREELLKTCNFFEEFTDYLLRHM